MSGDEEIAQLPRKPKTKRGKKVLDDRKPKLEEGPKQTLFLRGPKSSDDVRLLMKDLYQLKKDFSVLFSRKHDVRPFENSEQVEHYMQQTDCSMFCYVSHSKKRPNNVVLGRTYNGKVLDMVELSLTKFAAQDTFGPVTVPAHSRPLLVFQGEVFGYHATFMKLHNLLTDFFYENVPIVNKNQIQLIIFISATETTLDLSVFQRTPEQPQVQEVGPRCSFQVRREQFADEDTTKRACRQPKPKKKPHNKNVVHDAVGDRKGRIFVQQQDLGTLAIKRRKKLLKHRQKVQNIVDQQTDD